MSAYIVISRQELKDIIYRAHAIGYESISEYVNGLPTGWRPIAEAPRMGRGCSSGTKIAVVGGIQNLANGTALIGATAQAFTTETTKNPPTSFHSSNLRRNDMQESMYNPAPKANIGDRIFTSKESQAMQQSAERFIGGLAGRATATETPQPDRPEVLCRLEALCSAFNDVEGSLDMLIKRLEPVLAIRNLDNAKEPNHDPEPLTQLGREIYGYTKSMRRYNSTINDIINRLGV